jgi:FkbM family methyltransferase
MYSQNDEEQYILEHFAYCNAGRFYDIGAWTGIKFSNTRALLERGWSGVLVEPSPTAFVGLMENTKQYSERVTLVNAAITAKPELLKFYDAAGDAVGTLSEAHHDLWQPHMATMRELYIWTLPAAALFQKFGPAEFINLDVEGINWEIFACLPFQSERLRMICVEQETQGECMLQLAAHHGFRCIHKTAENLLLAR